MLRIQLHQRSCRWLGAESVRHLLYRWPIGSLHCQDLIRRWVRHHNEEAFRLRLGVLESIDAIVGLVGALSRAIVIVRPRAVIPAVLSSSLGSVSMAFSSWGSNRLGTSRFWNSLASWCLLMDWDRTSDEGPRFSAT